MWFCRVEVTLTLHYWGLKMGQPAARTLDQSAHGGIIMGPGCPTVMIGGMPAVRLSDMHVCPMLNPGVPPPPHVGANIAKGSATVMIGGMPAARVSDILVCTGPPDMIAMGCPTVMIGDAGPAAGGGGGGGGGGSGGGGGGSSTGAVISAIIAASSPPASPPGGPPSREGIGLNTSLWTKQATRSVELRLNSHHQITVSQKVC